MSAPVDHEMHNHSQEIAKTHAEIEFNDRLLTENISIELLSIKPLGNIDKIMTVKNEGCWTKWE